MKIFKFINNSGDRAFLVFMVSVVGAGVVITYWLLSGNGGVSLSQVKASDRVQSKTSSDLLIEDRLDYWERVLELSPNYPAGYVNLANYYLQLGDLEKAGEMLEKARAIDPNFEGVLSTKEKMGE